MHFMTVAIPTAIIPAISAAGSGPALVTIAAVLVTGAAGVVFFGLTLRARRPPRLALVPARRTPRARG